MKNHQRMLVLGGLAALGLTATLGTQHARADLKVTYGQNVFAFGGSNAGSAQQGAVNHNINSPYYGYLYVADSTLNKIWICPPIKTQDGTGANAFDQDGAPTADPPTRYINVPGGSLTFGVTVGPDDTVWIASLNAGKVYSAPPVPTSGNSVDAVVQISGVSGVRCVSVLGPVTNATVFATAQGAAKVHRYAVSAPGAVTAGTATKLYTVDLSGDPYKLAVGNGVYSIGVDTDGNAYVANGIGTAAATRLYKIVATKDDDGNITGGKVDDAWKAIAPAGVPAMSALSSATFVADKTYKHGGYLYFSSMTGTGATSGQWNLRFDLDGNYLDGWGPAVATPPANYSVVTFRGSTGPTFVSSDDLGNTYHRSVAASNNSGSVKVFKRAPFLAAAGDATSAGDAVNSSPTAVDGVVYFGADDGSLYAYDTTTGDPIAGFPVKVAQELESPVRILSRPAVYFVNGEKKVYFTTDRGDVCRVDADGQNFISSLPNVNEGANDSTPAVLADGTVYVGGRTESGLGVRKLNADLTEAASQTLAGNFDSITSVAVYGNNVYVGVTGGDNGDIVVLKASDLTPQAAGVADGEGVTAPPFVSGSSAYVGTLEGNFYKVNSVTFTPDENFGAGGTGKAAIGEPLPGSAFNDGDNFYVGSAHGKVWKVDGATGTFSVLYNTGNSALSIPGVVVNRATSTLAFGVNEVPAAMETDGSGAAMDASPTGLFYQVPTNVTEGPVNAQVFRGYGDFTTTPTVSKASDNSGETPVTSYRFLIGSADGNVYAFSNR